jgi:hypothetical protein
VAVFLGVIGSHQLYFLTPFFSSDHLISTPYKFEIIYLAS